MEEKRPALKVNADVERNFRGSWSGYERDKLFYNPDGPFPRFFDAAYVLGLDFDDDGRAAVPVDIDGDGDLDLALLSLQGLRLMENRAPARSFARLRLRAARGHVAAIGALVKLRAGGVTQQEHVRIVDGFLSQVPLDLHFGLGAAPRIEELEVRWPDGEIERWTDLPAGRLLEVRQGEREARATSLAAWPADARPPALHAASPQATARRLEGGDGPLAAAGMPAVVNFWAPTCAPCREELPRLAALHREFGAEVRFCGVSLETADLDAVRRSVQDFAVPYPNFVADDALVRAFFGGETRLPIPATFVFDGAGRLRRLYRRAVEEAELAALLRSFRDEGRFATDLLIRGSNHLMRLEYARARDVYREGLALRPEDPRLWHGLGLAAVGLGDHSEALRAFRECVRRDPQHADAQYNLGIALRKLGQPGEAIAAFEAALSVEPLRRDALDALGAAAAEAGRVELALEAFERGARAHPGWADPWVGKAKVLLLARRSEEALAALEKALALDPNHREALALRAQIRAGAGR